MFGKFRTTIFAPILIIIFALTNTLNAIESTNDTLLINLKNQMRMAFVDAKKLPKNKKKTRSKKKKKVSRKRKLYKSKREGALRRKVSTKKRKARKHRSKGHKKTFKTTKRTNSKKVQKKKEKQQTQNHQTQNQQHVTREVNTRPQRVEAFLERFGMTELFNNNRGMVVFDRAKEVLLGLSIEGLNTFASAITANEGSLYIRGGVPSVADYNAQTIMYLAYREFTSPEHIAAIVKLFRIADVGDGSNQVGKHRVINGLAQNQNLSAEQINTFATAIDDNKAQLFTNDMTTDNRLHAIWLLTRFGADQIRAIADLRMNRNISLVDAINVYHQ